MASILTEIVHAAYGDSRAWKTLEHLTAIGSRAAGQEGERRGAELVERRFERAGLERVAVDRFPIPGWWRGSSSLKVEGPYSRTFEFDTQIIALPGTPSGTVTAPLVDLNHGLPSDFRSDDLDDAIVLTASSVPEGHERWVHRNEKYARAVQTGASGFLFSSHEPGSLPTTGYVGFATGDYGEIPGAGLSFETGERLRRICAVATATGTLSIDCRTDRATSQNVEGTLGPETEREVLLTAHHDCHDIAEGAGDNGVGCALVTESARLLATVADQLETTVRFVTFGAEEPGMYGSNHWLETYDGDSVKALVNIDGVGDNRTLHVNSAGFEAAGDVFADVASELDVPITRENDIRPHGDHWSFVKRGVPAIGVGSGGRGRFTHAHTPADTIDKIDKRDLRDLALVISCGVLELSKRNQEFSRRSPSEIGDEMAAGYETGLKAEGRWPFD